MKAGGTSSTDVTGKLMLLTVTMKSESRSANNGHHIQHYESCHHAHNFTIVIRKCTMHVVVADRQTDRNREREKKQSAGDNVWIRYVHVCVIYQIAEAERHIYASCNSYLGHHWIRWWLFTCSTSSQYLNHCWLILDCDVWTRKLSFSYQQHHLKMSSAKYWPFCLGRNMLKFV